MIFDLEREVDGEWYRWGTYNMENENEVNAFAAAVWQFAGTGTKVRVVKREQG